MISVYKIIGHRNFHPKSLNNAFLWQWPLDYRVIYYHLNKNMAVVSSKIVGNSISVSDSYMYA